MIPTHTNTNAKNVFHWKFVLSPRMIADKITPKIGVKKPNTATLDTGLYFKSRLHKVYAPAEINPMYNNRAKPLAVTA